MNTEIEEVLYGDGGVFSKLRAGIYEKDESKLDIIRKFAKEVNTDIRNGRANAEDVVYIVAIVHDMFIFSAAGWTTRFATEIYETVNDMVGL